MAIQFPANPSNNQLYPDTDNGDPALESGRVYQYDSSQGLWLIKEKEPQSDFIWKYNDTYTSDGPRSGEFQHSTGRNWYDINITTFAGKTLFDTIGKTWGHGLIGTDAAKTGSFSMSFWDVETGQLRATAGISTCDMIIDRRYDHIHLYGWSKSVNASNHLVNGKLYKIVCPPLFNP